MSRHFTPQLFDFLRDLADHNDREWFQANKRRYDDAVKAPLLEFIGDFAPRVERFAPHITAIPKAVGGSMFRIHRDVRFGKDKRPYKTHAAAHFRHGAGKDVHAPGLYLHLEPGSVFAGAGLWRPDNPSLGKLRDAIAGAPETWTALVEAEPFASHWRISDEDKLKRPPAGYDKEHPLIEVLKRKSHTAFVDFTEDQACADDFLDRFVQACEEANDWLRFLAQAVEMAW